MKKRNKNTIIKGCRISNLQCKCKKNFNFRIRKRKEKKVMKRNLKFCLEHLCNLFNLLKNCKNSLKNQVKKKVLQLLNKIYKIIPSKLSKM